MPNSTHMCHYSFSKIHRWWIFVFPVKTAVGSVSVCLCFIIPFQRFKDDDSCFSSESCRTEFQCVFLCFIIPFQRFIDFLVFTIKLQEGLFLCVGHGFIIPFPSFMNDGFLVFKWKLQCLHVCVSQCFIIPSQRFIDDGFLVFNCKLQEGLLVCICDGCWFLFKDSWIMDC